jgi:hypothetical protein
VGVSQMVFFPRKRRTAPARAEDNQGRRRSSAVVSGGWPPNQGSPLRLQKN